MFAFLIGVEVVISILLIIAVLMQASKGGGLAGTFGGGNVGMMFGVRRTSDFLMRATQGLALAFGILALLINMVFLPRESAENIESILQRSAQTQQQTAPAPSLPQLPPPSQPENTPPQGQ
ncbi:MAG: preprotein translocase subunit SecG [Bacteroidetes bacterium]|nr:preprotein translocase subunit SecG [Bacteroidota bacterium]MCW5896301.1 preprotein translocase subunit SecG [Bacteroidota bacterium]